jgi:histidinol-phosphatase (PHP family)
MSSVDVVLASYYNDTIKWNKRGNMIDLHIHSLFSGDGILSLDAICEKAVAMGLSAIAITDHIDWDWPHHDIVFDIPDIDAYLTAVSKAADRYGNQLCVLKGIEIGLQAHLLGKTRDFVRSHDFDYVIASVHLAGGLDPYDADYFEGKTKEESYALYYRTMLHLIAEYDDFDALGHMDYVRRYCPYPVGPDDDSMEIIDRILAVLVKKNKALEINTSGLYAPLGETMPSPRVWKRFLEMGGRMLTVGSDAHRAAHIGYGLPYVYEYLGEDTAHLYYFQNRMPHSAL